MALNRDQMGLLFRLDADSKPAKQDLAAFREFAEGAFEDIQLEAREQAKKTTAAMRDIGDTAEKLDRKFDGAGRKGADGLDKLGKSSSANAKIIKESVETISSEIIESFGIDGDIANTLGQQISGLSKTTLIAGGVFIGLTAIVAGTTAALFALASSTAETLTAIGDLNEKTGVSVETLSGLKPTLEQNGASLDKFGGAIEELNDKLVKARGGNKELADGFKKLGVDIQQGTEPALKQIVQRYNELPEGAERTAFATNVFGSAGADLVLTLNSLNGNLDANTEKMRELGLVVTPEAVKEAKRFDDQMKALERQFEAFKVSAGSLVIPVFTSIIEQVNGAISSLQKLGAEFPRVSAGLKLLTLGVLSATTGAQLGQTDQQKINEDAANALAIEEDLIRRQQGDSKKGNALPFGDGKKKGRGGARAAGLDAETQAKLQLLRIEEQAANRLADAEIQAARRALDEKAVTLADYESAVIAAETRMIEAKRKTFAEEKRLVEASKLKGAPRDAKLAEIAEREAAAEQRSAETIARTRADVEKRREQLAEQAETIREKAAEEHAKRLEDIAKLSDDRQIAQIKAAADARQITEQQAAERIAAIRIAAFAREEDRLKARLDKARAKLAEPATGGDPAIAAKQRAELLAAEQSFVDQLKVLEDERANAVEEGERRIAEARDRDLQNLLKAAEEQKRLYQELDEARKIAERGQLGARSLFGDGFADSLRTTGSELQAFQALFASFGASIRAELEQLPSLADTAFGAMTDGLTQMAIAFVTTGQTGPAALKQLAAGVLQAVAKMAATKAIFELAEGLAALARAFFGDPRAGAEAALHFKAAAIYGAVALVAGAAGRAVAPAAGGGGASGGGGAGGDQRRDGGKNIIEQGGALRDQKQQIIVIRTEVGEGTVVRHWMEDFRGNGVTRSATRRDLLNES